MNLLLLLLVGVVVVLQVSSLFETLGLSSRLSSVNSITNQTGRIGYVTVSAVGTASAVSTIGTLYLSVEGRGKTAAAATSSLSAELLQVNSSVKSYINGNSSLIKTTYYDLANNTNMTYPYSYNTYNGFVAVEYLTITIPNVKNVSPAIGVLSLINNTEVTGASASLSNAQVTALRSEALAGAMQNATAQASILTRNASLSVNNVTVNQYHFYPVPFMLGSSAAKGGAVSPSFYSGTASVTESVTVVFTYKKYP